MVELMRRKIDLGIAQSPTSFVDQSGNVVTADHFSSMSLVESLQHDYALAAIEHIKHRKVVSSRATAVTESVRRDYVDSVRALLCIKNFNQRASYSS